MQSERQLERRRELALEEHAGDVGREPSGAELSPVDPAEDDRRAGIHLGSVGEHEVERRPQRGDDDVDPLVRVLLAKVVLEEERVADPTGSGKVHRLAIHLDSRSSRPQRPNQTRVENGQPWQLGTLVVQQHDPAHLRRRGRGEDHEQQQQAREAPVEGAAHELNLRIDQLAAALLVVLSSHGKETGKLSRQSMISWGQPAKTPRRTATAPTDKSGSVPGAWVRKNGQRTVSIQAWSPKS